MATYTLDIRERRQVTLPSELLKKLGADIGDSIEVKIKEKEKTATMKSKKQLALEAFKELQRAFKESGISEKEMQDNARRIRKQINEERSS